MKHCRGPCLRLRLFVFLVLTTSFWNLALGMSVKPLTMSTPSTSLKSMNLSLGGAILRELVTEAARYDNEESSLDLCGIVWLEHINLVVESKSLAEDFYLNVLGCTPDAGKSFHVNLGQQQFHLAENGDPPQYFAGSIGLAIPDVSTLEHRIEQAQEKVDYQSTDFQLLVSSKSRKEGDNDSGNNDSAAYLTLCGPWGNIFHLYSIQDDNKLSKSVPLETSMKMINMHGEGGDYGSHRMAVRGQPGIRFVEIACPKKKSSAVAKFYRTMLGCTVYETTVTNSQNTNESTACAVVSVGPGVHLVFVEQSSEILTQEAIKAMEGIHICIYVYDFINLYKQLADEALIWTNPRFTHLDSCDTVEKAIASRTLRFKNIIDIDTGDKILELEHETRPLRHGQFLKVPKYEPR